MAEVDPTLSLINQYIQRAQPLIQAAETHPPEYNTAIGTVGECLVQLYLEDQGMLAAPYTKERRVGDFLARAMGDSRLVSPVMSREEMRTIREGIKGYPPDFIAIQSDPDAHIITDIFEVKIRKPIQGDVSLYVNREARTKKRWYSTFYPPFTQAIHYPEYLQAPSIQTELDNQSQRVLLVLDRTVKLINAVRGINAVYELPYNAAPQNPPEPPILNTVWTERPDLPGVSPMGHLEEAIGFALEKPLRIASDVRVHAVVCNDDNWPIPSSMKRLPLPLSYTDVAGTALPSLYPDTKLQPIPGGISIEGYFSTATERILPLVVKLFSTSLTAEDNEAVEARLLSIVLGRPCEREEATTRIIPILQRPPLLDIIWSSAKRLSGQSIAPSGEPSSILASQQTSLSPDERQAIYAIGHRQRLTLMENFALIAVVKSMNYIRKMCIKGGVSARQPLTDSLLHHIS